MIAPFLSTTVAVVGGLAVMGIYWNSYLENSRKEKELKRAKLGQCQKCGYDMRATPELCPECGTSYKL